MQNLILKAPSGESSLSFSPRVFVFNFRSLSYQYPNSLGFSHGKRHFSGTSTLCSTTTSNSLSYGGWDDLRLAGDSFPSGQHRHILYSLGIDDKKYFFVYLLGFVCALAISRIRVSSFIVFPACVTVFAVGFSVGFVNGGHWKDLSLVGATRKRDKDENFKGLENLRNLVGMFDDFNVRIGNLKNGIRRGIQCNQVTVQDLESYVKRLELIRVSASNGRDIVHGYIDRMSDENQVVERTSNQKTIRKKKEVEDAGFDWFQFVCGVFQGKSVGSKHDKIKDLVRKDSVNVEVNGHNGGNILTSSVAETISKSVNGDASDSYALGDGRGCRDEELVDIYKENGYPINRLRFRNSRQVCLSEVETWTSHDCLLDPVDIGINKKHMKTEASFSQDQIFQKFNGNYGPSDSNEMNENGMYKSHVVEKKVTPNDDPFLDNNHTAAHEGTFVPSQSSAVSDDMSFNNYLVEANDLLQQARECLRDEVDEARAENALHKSAVLLSRAIDMKPMSLLAVGQLGNSYLLHGELKLKISRELRDVLTTRKPLSTDKWSHFVKGLDDQVRSRDKIASLLVNVCQECEELLVKAGRNYKLALSIDGNDMRTLYNWGLALSFRAQLIADIGPEAAADADKVYLAAIDKFDAMMSKTNVYAPDALFRWGSALQQRSWLRPRNSPEKVKLLQQAKRLYEDALEMDPTNLQVRKGLSSCISELRYRNH